MDEQFSIKDFSGGITTNLRNSDSSLCAVVTNFDIFSDPHRLIPYYDSVDGDAGSATSQKQNFSIALRTGTTYNLFSFGRQSATAKAEVLMKALTTGASNDLDDSGWATPANNQSSAVLASQYSLFVYYKKQARIFGNETNNIFSFDPTSAAAFNDAAHSLSYTVIAQGLVHSKDDILYIPYDNKIASNNNGSWNDTALTLPSNYVINSICEYGNYLAIACAPVNGIDNSRVFLWDRDSSLTTLSESIDWGVGVLKILEEIEGYLIGVTVDGGNSTKSSSQVIFRYYSGTSGAIRFNRIDTPVGSATILINSKQKVNNRIFFLLSATINGAIREGLFSVGKSKSGRFALSHERTPFNDTALGAGILKAFFIVGDFTFISYINNGGSYAVSKTNDQASYTATSIYETLKLDGGDASRKKELAGVATTYDPLPTAGQVVLKYKKDSDTTFSSTVVYTETTDNEISTSSTGKKNVGKVGNHKEQQFRIESTGGAMITSLAGKVRIMDKRSW